MSNNWTRENIMLSIEKSSTYKEVLENMGLKPYSTTYGLLKKYLYMYSIDFESIRFKIKDKWKEDNLKQVVHGSTSYSQVLDIIGLSRKGDNIKTLKKYIEKYDLDISHFNLSFINSKSKKINEILIENSPYKWTSNLKKRLYKEGLKERKCEECGQGEEWRGKKFSLILDHINGINDDNRIENLRILCPNCNATLDTHCGKNIKKEKKKYYCECGKEKNTKYKKYCNECSIIKGSRYNKNNSSSKEKKKYYCECGKEIKKSSTMCEQCYHKLQRKVERPTIDQLLLDVKELGYRGSGKKYGVSDNSIRKWIKNYEKNK